MQFLSDSEEEHVMNPSTDNFIAADLVICLTDRVLPTATLFRTDKFEDIRASVSLDDFELLRATKTESFAE
jgi:hypothetical protein